MALVSCAGRSHLCGAPMFRDWLESGRRPVAMARSLHRAPQDSELLPEGEVLEDDPPAREEKLTEQGEEAG